MDALGGTWLRNLFGWKLWFIVPESNISEEDWKVFGKEGHHWNPGSKARGILLRPSDVFFMLLGMCVIHAVFTLETCLMEGGIV